MCFSLKPTRTEESLVCILMSDLHAKSLLTMEGLEMQGKKKQMEQGWILVFFVTCAARALWLLLSWLSVPTQPQWTAPLGPTLLPGRYEGLCGGQWSSLPKQGIQPWTGGSPHVPCSCWVLALREETKGLIATALAALANLVGWESCANLDTLINVSWFSHRPESCEPSHLPLLSFHGLSWCVFKPVPLHRFLYCPFFWLLWHIITSKRHRSSGPVLALTEYTK